MFIHEDHQDEQNVHSKKCWVQYNPELGKVWTNPAFGLIRPSSWVTAQKVGLNILPNCWLKTTQHVFCPIFTQHWVVFNPALFVCCSQTFFSKIIQTLVQRSFWGFCWGNQGDAIFWVGLQKHAITAAFNIVNNCDSITGSHVFFMCMHIHSLFQHYRLYELLFTRSREKQLLKIEVRFRFNM